MRAPSYPLALAAFIGGFFAVWTAWVFLAWRLDLVPAEVRPWIRTIIWLAAPIIWVRWMAIKDPIGWLGLAPIGRKAAVVSVVAFVVILAFNALRVSVAGGAPGRMADVTALALLSACVSVFVEELVFRGVVQTALRDLIGSISAVLVAAVLFVLIHVPGWLMLGFPAGAGLVASVFAIGLICGVLREATKSLWPAVAAHLANNIGALL